MSEGLVLCMMEAASLTLAADTQFAEAAVSLPREKMLCGRHVLDLGCQVARSSATKAQVF